MNQNNQTIILVNDHFDQNLIRTHVQDNPNAKIFSLNYTSHEFLTKQKIPHEWGENYLNEHDYDEINKISKNLSQNWYQHPDIRTFFEFNEINFGNLLEIELSQYFLSLVLNIFTFQKIIDTLKPDKIISFTNFNDFIKKFCETKNIELISINKQNQNKLVLEDLNLKLNLFNFPLSFKISRKNYLFLKNSFEKLLTFFINSKNHSHEKSILLMDFNPMMYDELLYHLSKLNKNIFLLNARRPAIWNFSSFNIVKNNHCNVVSILKNEKKLSAEINSKKISFFKTHQNLWEKNDIFNSIFSINSISFWSSIKESFKQICFDRFSESIRLALIFENLLLEIRPSVVLQWAETAMEEKILINIAKKHRIPIVYLQHTLASIQEYSRPSGQFISHFGYPFLSDTQAVWGNSTLDYAKKYRNSNSISVGSPRHDKFFNHKPKNKNGIKILFAPTLPSNISSSNISTLGVVKFNKFISETCNILKNIPDIDFVIKPHPTPSTVYDIPKLIHDVDSNIKITYDSDIVSLIEESELIITTNNSTIAIDALILKKPVITLQTNPLFMTDDLVQSKAVCAISEISEIEPIITKILHDQNFKTDLLNNSKIFLKQNFSNQGTSSNILSTFLNSF